MLARRMGLLLLAAVISGCTGAGGHTDKAVSATPLPTHLPKSPPLADGLYGGYWGRVAGSENDPNCPRRRPGTLAIGDNTLSIASDDMTNFVVPVPPNGPLYAVAGKTTLSGVRTADGGMAFTTTSPTCTMRFDVRFLPGF